MRSATGVIIAFNTGTQGANCDNFQARLVDTGYNLETDTAARPCGFSARAHDLVGVNPRLRSLGDYGGPTLTAPPAPSSIIVTAARSPEIDAPLRRRRKASTSAELLAPPATRRRVRHRRCPVRTARTRIVVPGGGSAQRRHPRSPRRQRLYPQHAGHVRAHSSEVLGVRRLKHHGDIPAGTWQRTGASRQPRRPFCQRAAVHLHLTRRDADRGWRRKGSDGSGRSTGQDCRARPRRAAYCPQAGGGENRGARSRA